MAKGLGSLDAEPQVCGNVGVGEKAALTGSCRVTPEGLLAQRQYLGVAGVQLSAL